MSELFDGEAGFKKASEKAVIACIDKLLEKLEEISPNARDDALHALLYGFSDYSPANPPLAAIKSYLQKVLAAAEKTGVSPEEARRLAEQASEDRLDPDTEQVKLSAARVMREFDRLRGILRFKPDNDNETQYGGDSQADNCYTARCAPDHFVLPLLANHFWQRFGKQSWAIVDEKRKLVLSGDNGKEPVLRQLGVKEKVDESGTEQEQKSDEWEGLWKNYHSSINNEQRANPKLQKQFMPSRYRKYLTEFK
ncbi:MAG: TIGR03915 family putative DNA repair protein [Treponema sp.]|nr:TIGR03915 family putative DNA repair protein [Treponema sp.]